MSNANRDILQAESEQGMTSSWRTLIFVSTLSLCNIVSAMECNNSHFKVATGLVDLPKDVRELILKRGPIADSSQDFWKGGDVVPPDALKLPKRHLVLAVVGDDRAAAIIEYSVIPAELWIFSLTNSKWEASVQRSSVDPSASRTELLESICDDYPQEDPRPTSAYGTITNTGDIILTLSSANMKTTYKLIRNPGTRGKGEYNQITYFQSGKQLSPEERAMLSNNLTALKKHPSYAKATRKYITVYMDALKSNPINQGVE